MRKIVAAWEVPGSGGRIVAICNDGAELECTAHDWSRWIIKAKRRIPQDTDVSPAPIDLDGLGGDYVPNGGIE